MQWAAQSSLVFKGRTAYPLHARFSANCGWIILRRKDYELRQRCATESVYLLSALLCREKMGEPSDLFWANNLLLCQQ